MQLLPLLLLPIFCLLVAEASRPDEWKDRPVSPRDKTPVRGRFGKLSPEAKKRLAKEIGNLDARKALLARIKGPKALTAEQKAKLKERLAKIPRYERSEEDKAADLFEINRKEGVSEFMFQGDMELTEKQAEELQSSSDPARKKRQVSSARKWTNNTVYYYFEPLLSKYVENKKKANVGMLDDPEQIVSLGNGCETLGTAAHEFMHALGIGHTHSRTDRDDYVTIDLTYVSPEDQGSYKKQTGLVNLTPYDYGSVMHYNAAGFTNTTGEYTIIPHDIDYIPYMGLLGNTVPTFLDILMINKHYGCDTACPPATSAQCKNGGEPNVHNCSVCMCPIGYDGTLCDQRPPGCGETLTATASWQLKSVSYAGNAKTSCTFWITAPEEQKIEIQFVSMTGTQCEDRCSTNSVEIKRGPDNRIAFPKHCCPEFTNRTTLSSANPTPVIIYSHYANRNFTFKYRAVPANPISSTLPPTTKLPTTTTTTELTTATTTELPTTTTELTTTTTTELPTTELPTTTTELPTTTTELPTTTTELPTTTTELPTTTTKLSTTTRKRCQRTTKLTTTQIPRAARLPPRNCSSMWSPSGCGTYKAEGSCTNSTISFHERKYMCAVECGFCGKTADPCVDVQENCPEVAANGACTRYHPMLVEYWCAKTCGYCDHPN